MSPEQRPQWSRREVDDPRAMRALAHPLRQALLEALFREGPLTATQAAEMLDENPGNISWHFQTLARYGFVEEAEGGRGRSRPWKLSGQTNTFHIEGEGSSDALAAETALMASLMRTDLRRLNDWVVQRQAYGAEWRQAAFTTHTLTYLTAEELSELSEELVLLTMKYRDRVTDVSKRPAGSLPVQVIAFGHPIVPATGATGD